MILKTILKTGIAAAVIAASATSSYAAPAKPRAATASAQPVVLSVGRGQQVNLPSAITDVVVANPDIADVTVRSAKQIYIVAKGPGETTVYATDASGRNVYSATVRVGNNLDSVDQLLALAMPEADIKVATMNGVVLLTGTVFQPEDIVEAEDIVAAYVGPTTKVISRLKTATPMQVNLQVRFAEVNRSLSKEISSNLTTRDNDGVTGDGFLFMPSRGREVAEITTVTDPDTKEVLGTSTKFKIPAGGNNVLNMAKNLFGIDFALGLDFAERAGLATTLAQPNLTTMSGETANFLAGGQFPFPTAAGLGSTTVDFRDYGVILEYTPLVMADGRIRLRVKPEVSELSNQGSLRINDVEIPAITTRSTETTVELGSGQSFMIAGLLSSSQSSTIEKFPGLGDVPVLGQLFKSNGWKRNETELVIIITPYLVKPISEAEVKLPTDGYNAPSDLERLLLNKTATNVNSIDQRPMPTVAPAAPNGPEFSAMNGTQTPGPVKQSKNASGGSSKPGFSFD
jgi:pilus assembly protein CpaC